MARRAKQNVLLTVWLLLPAVAVGLMLFWIISSFRTGPAMHEPGVGAGAGDAGGANAVGEMLRDEDGDDDADSDDSGGNTGDAADE